MCSSCSVAQPLYIAAYSTIAFLYTYSQSSNTAQVCVLHAHFYINKHVYFFAALVPSTDSAVSDAIQEVEELRMEHSKSSSLQLSNKQLHDLLTLFLIQISPCLEIDSHSVVHRNTVQESSLLCCCRRW